MIYRQRNKKSALGLRLVVGCVIVFVLFRIFNINVMSGLTQNAFNGIIESKSGLLSPLRTSLVYFKSKNDLQEENDRLKSENADLRLDVLTQEAATQEYEMFKSQFATIPESANAVKVILRPPFTPFDLVRLGGNLDAYAEGSQVFYKSVAIGTLVEKSGRYGSVELYSTPGKVTPASVKGSQFEAKGLGGGRYLLEAPKDFDIKEGDPIVFPGEQVVLLGVVGQIESNEEDLFKRVFFNLPAPLSTISYVTIGLPQTTYEQTEPIE